MRSNDQDGRIAALEARVKVLEAENEYLRTVNMALSEGKQPAEVLIEASVPDRKIKKPGRPGIEPWESGQMKKLRKDGWTVREIADRYGRSIGAVQKVVSDVEPDPVAVEKHREERNKALSESRKSARAARKRGKK